MFCCGDVVNGSFFLLIGCLLIPKYDIIPRVNDKKVVANGHKIHTKEV